MASFTIATILLILTCVAFAIPRIPMAVTAVLASLAMVIADITTPAQALSFFGSDAVIMVAGTSVIANAVFETGLAARVGRGIMQWRWAVESERHFLFVMFGFTALLSTVIGNVPVLAIMFPIASAVTAESGGRITRRNLYMAMAIASCLGGNVTLSGASMNILAQGILESVPGAETFNFFTLTAGAVPALLVALLYFMTGGYTLQKKTFTFTDAAGVAAQDSPPLNKPKAILTAAFFGLCVVGFVMDVWSIGITALLGATLCVLTGCISFKTAMKKMDWTTICVLAGALGFAKGVNDSGACARIAEIALALLGGAHASPHIVLLALILIGGVFTNVMQNNAVVAILLPIAITMAQTLGCSTLPFSVAVVFGASFAFATPIGTAPLTMSLSAGYRFGDYVRVGGLCELLVLLATAVCIPIFYPF